MNFYDEIKAAYQEWPQNPKETLLSYDDRITLQSLIGYLKYSALFASSRGKTSFTLLLLTSNTETFLRYKDKKGEDCAMNEGFAAQLLDRKHPKLQKEIATIIKEAFGPDVIFRSESKPFIFDEKKTSFTLSVSWACPQPLKGSDDNGRI